MSALPRRVWAAARRRQQEQEWWCWGSRTVHCTAVQEPPAATNSCTRAAEAAGRCPSAWWWALPWWRPDRCPGPRTSCRRLGRRGVRRSASRWCCLWRWSQRIQTLKKSSGVRRCGPPSQVALLLCERGESAASRPTQLLRQQPAAVHRHHSLLLHVTLVPGQNHLSVIPRICFYLGRPVEKTTSKAAKNRGFAEVKPLNPLFGCDFFWQKGSMRDGGVEDVGGSWTLTSRWSRHQVWMNHSWQSCKSGSTAPLDTDACKKFSLRMCLFPIYSEMSLFICSQLRFTPIAPPLSYIIQLLLIVINDTRQIRDSKRATLTFVWICYMCIHLLFYSL